ncbi:phiSA1p31-related protein [Streptomyces sp. EN16]|uniref:phiSA1p31-related protein n=1 Tax=Streptomyces sp. EN16 TaxID=212773 RepID=UPI0008520427|nr:phiSA1p31-related protein [Streptomyces sp. EN16]
MTDTPMTPEYEQRIRSHVAEMSNYSLGNLFARDLLAEVDRLRKALSEAASQVAELESDLGGASARIAKLEASVCRCFDPSHHAPDCERATVVWNGVRYNAAAWYRDAEGFYWMACGVDDQGQPLMRVRNDHSNEPVPVGEVESDYGPLYRSDDGPDDLQAGTF